MEYLRETILVAYEGHDVRGQGRRREASLDDRCYLHQAYCALEYTRISNKKEVAKTNCLARRGG